MRWKNILAETANRFLRPLGAEIVGHGTAHELKPWDAAFLKWIEAGKTAGKDPNDFGDEDWRNDPLRQTLERFYLCYIDAQSVVLELGPGTGRTTRHVIGKCGKMILVDYSQVVCDWLDEYLKNKGTFETHRITSPNLSFCADGTVDFILANGVFEHIDLDDTYWFLTEFSRVLKGNGKVSFNFENFEQPTAMKWFHRHATKLGDRCIFRFYTPSMMRELGNDAGLEVVVMENTSTDIHPREHVVMRKR
jgi:cyclopropane fatty-acyl-phospholipid synthase-like methyltransferase